MLIDDLLRSDRRDFGTLPLRAGLRSLALLYGGAVSVRNALYDCGIPPTVKAPCRVVSIGALAAGGTGKTPVVIMTARLLAGKGCSIAVVSRGYRRNGTGVRIVSDGAGNLIGPREAGDEPHLIASALPGVPVIVGERRGEAAMLAWERFRPGVILLDDGFQHRALVRDIDVVTLDAARPFGNGCLLPRGLLREPPESLARAGVAVFTRCPSDLDRVGLEAVVRRSNPRIEVFFSRHAPSRVRGIPDGTVSDPGSLRGKRVAALSSVADPASFYGTIESLGASVVLKRPMPDHHRHTQAELVHTARLAARAGAEALVATAKDERNLPDPLPPLPLELLILDIEAELIDGNERYREVLLSRSS